MRILVPNTLVVKTKRNIHMFGGSTDSDGLVLEELPVLSAEINSDKLVITLFIPFDQKHTVNIALPKDSKFGTIF